MTACRQCSHTRHKTIWHRLYETLVEAIRMHTIPKVPVLTENSKNQLASRAITRIEGDFQDHQRFIYPWRKWIRMTKWPRSGALRTHCKDMEENSTLSLNTQARRFPKKQKSNTTRPYQNNSNHEKNYPNNSRLAALWTNPVEKPWICPD